MEVIVEQPRSLGARPKDRAAQDNAAEDNAAPDKSPDNAGTDRTTGDFLVLHSWIELSLNRKVQKDLKNAGENVGL
jgi:hypothetical protein